MFIFDNIVSYTAFYQHQNILFIKLWGILSAPENFVQTILPGNIEGISGSSVGGSNLGKYIYI